MSRIAHVYWDGQGTTTTHRLPVDAALVAPTATATAEDYTRDSYARQRTVSPATLFESDFNDGQETCDWAEAVTATGAVAYSAPYVTLSAPAAADDATWQTRRFMPYQIGKSAMVILHAVLDDGTGAAGDIAEAGYNDGSDGWLFRFTVGGSLQVVEQESVDTGSEQAVSRAAFNVDPLDGTGPSGLDLSATFDDIAGARMIYWIEVNWAAGSATLGIVYNRAFLPLHRFDDSSPGTVRAANSSLVDPITARADLPLRFYVSGSTGGIVLRAFGAAMSSDGGQLAPGRCFSTATSAVVPVLAGLDLTEQWLLALRPTSGTRSLIRPLRLDATIRTGARHVEFRVIRLISPVSPSIDDILDGGTAVAFSAVDSACSRAEFAVNYDDPNFLDKPLDLTGADYKVLARAYDTSSMIPIAESALSELTSDIAGVRDVLIITARRLDGTVGQNEDVMAAVTWTEY